MRLFRVISLLFMMLCTSSAFATTPAQAIHEAVQILIARHEYNLDLYRYLVDPSVDENEKKSYLREVTGHHVFPEIQTQEGFSKFKKAVLRYVKDYRQILQYVSPEVINSENGMHPLSDVARESLNKFNEAFAVRRQEVRAFITESSRKFAASLGEEIDLENLISDSTELERLRMLSTLIFYHLEEEKIIRKRFYQRKSDWRVELESGYAEEPFLIEALKVVESALPAWCVDFRKTIQVKPLGMDKTQVSLTGIFTLLNTESKAGLVELSRILGEFNNIQITESSSEEGAEFFSLVEQVNSTFLAQREYLNQLRTVLVNNRIISGKDDPHGIFGDLIDILAGQVAAHPVYIIGNIANRNLERFRSIVFQLDVTLKKLKQAVSSPTNLNESAHVDAALEVSKEPKPEVVEEEEEEESTADYRYVPYVKSKEESATNDSEPVSPLIALKDKFKHKKDQTILNDIFSSQIHAQFRFGDLKRLIEFLNGSVTQQGTSHCRIFIPSVWTGKSGLSFSFVPHGREDNKVPSRVVKAFQFALTQAGITPESIVDDLAQ